MEPNQMSKFCIELEGMMLPDAIAAVVEAWYDAQGVDLSNDLMPMADLANRWGITANTVSRRLRFLGIKPIRQGNYRFITAEQLALGDELQQHVLSGKPMELFALDRRYAAATG